MPRLRFLSLALLVLSVAGPACADDNASPPHLATYRWDVSGLKRGEYANYAEWINRRSVWPEAFQPQQTWDHVRGGDWQLRPWGEYIAQNLGTRLIYSVTILPGPWDRSGPQSGTDAKVPVSLQEGAKGTYNQHFRILAENLVKHGLGDSILRPGWEFNGGWFTWRVTNPQDAEAFAGYWRQIVTTMRAVPGAEKLHFCWNPNIGWLSVKADLAWPGDAYVDSIGLDYYDDGYLPDTYPWPEGTPDKEIAARRQKVWDHFLNANYGLLWWRKFAREHGKPLAIPEWGLNKKPDGHGGLDNVIYIEGMHAFLTNPDNNVLFHCYFDVEAPDGGHQLSPGVDNKTTRFPEGARRFKELFGGPATVP